MLSRDRPVRVDVGAVLDLLARQVDQQALAFRVDTTYGHRRDEHPAAGQPSARVDDEVAHRPVDVVEIAAFDLTDRAIRRRERESHQRLYTDHDLLLAWQSVQGDCRRRSPRAARLSTPGSARAEYLGRPHGSSVDLSSLIATV